LLAISRITGVKKRYSKNSAFSFIPFQSTDWVFTFSATKQKKKEKEEVINQYNNYQQLAK
jgi:hypothetical protein